MIRARVILVGAAVVLVGAGCNDDDVTTATGGGQPGEATASTTSSTPGEPIPDHPVVDEDGVLYRITLPPGECQSCPYDLALGLDGVATYTAPDKDYEARTVTVANRYQLRCGISQPSAGSQSV
jgi:hypothetical protein